GPVGAAALPAGSTDSGHSAEPPRRSAEARTGAAARPPAGPLGSASHRPHSAGLPFGTWSPARRAATAPPPDAARPGSDGGLRARETAPHNVGTAPAPL